MNFSEEAVFYNKELILISINTIRPYFFRVCGVYFISHLAQFNLSTDFQFYYTSSSFILGAEQVIT